MSTQTVTTAVKPNPSHKIIFRIKHFGSEAILDEPIQITLEQYQALKDSLVNDRFVEINGEMINTSTIEKVAKIPVYKPTPPEPYYFVSEAEYQEAYAAFEKNNPEL